jgi:hypothetical protein
LLAKASGQTPILQLINRIDRPLAEVGTIRKLMAAKLASSRLKPVPLRHRMHLVGLILL